MPAPDNLQTQSIARGSIYGEEVISRRGAVRVFQGATNNINYFAVDDNNSVIIPPSLSAVKIRFSEGVLHDILIKEITPTSVDTSTGKITYSIPPEVQDYGGIYVSNIGLFDSSSKLVYTNKVYIYVEPSVWGINVGTCALPPLDEFRMSLKDSDVIENEILGDKQFSLEEICLAAIQTVRMWNETPPRLMILTTKTFGDPYILKRGMHLHLFDFHLEWLRKNRLPYNAGGTQVDEMGRLNEYSAALQMRFQEFQALMMRTKAALNLYSGFAKIG